MDQEDRLSRSDLNYICIVSNSQLLRQGLVSLLSPYIALELVSSYPGDPPGGVDFKNAPGLILLLDSGIGRSACLAWVSFCRTQQNPVKVLVMELANNIDLILESIEAGASGYALQGASLIEVARAIQQVGVGLAQCSPEVTARLFARLATLGSSRAAIQSVPNSLTARENEVLHYIAAGYSNKQIADVLFIELRTVKQHVHNILAKLDLQHRWQAAHIAREQGWVNIAR